MNRFRISHREWLRPALAASILVVSGTTLAAGAAEAPEQPGIQSVTPVEMQAAALTVKNQNGIDFVSGGIGVSERAWLAAHAKSYSARLSFAQVPGGAYLSGVKVTIRNASGKTVLSTDTDGPMLYANLPAGRYQLEASLDGIIVKRVLMVPKQGGRKWVIGFRQPKD